LLYPIVAVQTCLFAMPLLSGSIRLVLHVLGRVETVTSTILRQMNVEESSNVREQRQKTTKYWASVVKVRDQQILQEDETVMA
jgi:hypothetical protein